MRARRFSDNAFLLLPWQNKTVQFVGEGPFSLADLQRSLSVLSIADTLPSAQMKDLSLPNLNVRTPRCIWRACNCPRCISLTYRAVSTEAHPSALANAKFFGLHVLQLFA